MKTIYLANDYGFSQITTHRVLLPLVESLERCGVEVWEPFERAGVEFGDQFEKAGKIMTDPYLAYNIAQQNKKAIEKCDGFFAIINGAPPDEGVMIELGMAIILEKPIFLYRDDMRVLLDSAELTMYPLNLMIFTGLPKETWKDYLYKHCDELAEPNRPLMKWISQSG